MLEVVYSKRFLRQFKKISRSDTRLADEIKEKIGLFKNKSMHKQLKVHVIKGKLQGCYSFSVNYKHRIIFEYLKSSEAHLLDVGDHGIYTK